MKNFTVTFIDAGNCDIFHVKVNVLGYRSAITQAKIAYTAAGHKAQDIVEVRIRHAD